MTTLFTILFDGVAYGMLLFVLACGLHTFRVMPGQKREARLRARCAGHPRLSFFNE